jgi:hypothetical protein
MSMTKMYGNGLMFWVKEWTFKAVGIGEINWILRLDIFVAALINYRRQFTIKTKGSSFTDLMVK